MNGVLSHTGSSGASARSGVRPPVRPRRRRMRPLRMVGLVAFSVFAFLWVYPFIWMISASLKTSLEIFTQGLGLLPEAAQWHNYSRAWTEGGFAGYVINTLVVTIATVAIVVVRCALAGYVLGRYAFRGRKVYITVLVATLFVPTGYTIIPIIKLSQVLGLLDSLTGMVLALSGAANVAAILLYLAFYSRLPKELEEAAHIDGAGFLRTFWSVMLPLSMPVTATVSVLTFLGTWNAYFLPLVFSLSKPALRTVSVGMQAFVGQDGTDWSGMAAGGVIALVPVVLVFVFMQRYFVEGIAGALKS